MALPPHSFAERFIRTNLLSRFWGSTTGVVGLGTSFLTLTALSVHQFGLYQLVLAAFALADIFSVNFFDEVVRNDISRALNDGKKELAKRLFHELTALKVGLGIALAISFFLFADIIAVRYDKDIGVYIRIISFLIAVRAAQSASALFLGAVVSLRGMGAAAIEEISKLSLISAFFFFSNLTIERVLLSTLIASSAAFLYVGIAFWNEYRALFRGITALHEFQFKKVFQKYGLWVLMRNAVKRVARPFRPWLIAALLNSEAVALYTLAANLVTMVKNLFPHINPSLLAWEINNGRRLSYIFSRGLKYAFIYGVVLAAASFIFIPLLTEFFLPKYLAAMPLLFIFLISVPFHGVQDLEMAVLTSLREQRILAARLVAEIMIGTGLIILLVPFFGLLATAVGPVTAIIWRTWYLHRQIVKKYPELRPNMSVFWQFDRDDRLIAIRAFAETKLFLRSYMPQRWAHYFDKNDVRSV